jgi:hypothetical protein
MNRIADALYYSETSHGSVWRLMMASIILGNDQITDQARARYRSTTEHLTSSWKLYTAPWLQSQMQEGLVDFLMQCLKSWLKLMAILERVYVVQEGDTDWFNTEDGNQEEESRNVPGDFIPSTAVPPALCLFPAFLQTSSTGRTPQQNLLRKGMVLYPNSPTLVQALKDELQISSPKSARRMTLGSAASGLVLTQGE